MCVFEVKSHQLTRVGACVRACVSMCVCVCCEKKRNGMLLFTTVCVCVCMCVCVCVCVMRKMRWSHGTALHCGPEARKLIENPNRSSIMNSVSCLMTQKKVKKSSLILTHMCTYAYTCICTYIHIRTHTKMFISTYEHIDINTLIHALAEGVLRIVTTSLEDT